MKSRSIGCARFLLAALCTFPATLLAQTGDAVFQLPQAASGPISVFGAGACPTTPTVIYDTTRAANQGAEITAAANGAATCMGDLIVLDAMTTQRSVCEVSIDLFTLASTAPFDLTIEFYTACTTDGVGGSACGTGPGTLIPGSTATVTGITPPALGTLFTVVFPFPSGVDLSGEADNSISVKLNASRSDVFWRINETPTVGTIPAGEPATSFVERCGSAANNNGCQRNFGVNNNFAMTISAVEGGADLSITKTNGTTSSTPGTNATYTIVASNAGPVSAIGATVADSFPAACASTSWTCTGSNGGTCAAGGSGNINDTVDLPAGASVTYSAVCSIGASASGTLDNTATITPPMGLADPDPSNNSATDSDTLVASADLALLLTATPNPAAPGLPINFVATATNNGPSDAQDVQIAVQLGTGVAFASSSASAGGTCVTPAFGSGGTVSCSWAGATVPTASRSVAVTAYSYQANAGASASASSATSDSTPSNNAASASVTVGNGGAANPPTFIPTASHYGMAFLAVLLGLLGFVALRRQH